MHLWVHYSNAAQSTGDATRAAPDGTRSGEGRWEPLIGHPMAVGMREQI